MELQLLFVSFPLMGFLGLDGFKMEPLQFTKGRSIKSSYYRAYPRLGLLDFLQGFIRVL